MTEGAVKFFDATKHFGFINGDDGKSYYFHATQVEQGIHLTDGDRVSFTGMQAERGPKAEKVTKIPNEKKAKPDQEEAPEAAESGEPEGTKGKDDDDDEEEEDGDSEEEEEKKIGEDEGSPE